jgi:predicted metal-binding membrane protein
MGTWIVMMVAMMLPSLVPMLRRYRRAHAPRRGESTRSGLRTALVGAGYFFVWSAFGAAAFPIGVVLAAIEMQHPALARAVPIAVGVVMLIAGAFQFTTWKAHHLASWRAGAGPEGPPSPGVGGAWRHGVRLGLDCACCCANLMAILMFAGFMDLRAMAAVTAAITIERLAPGGVRAARVIGAVVVGAAILTLATSTACLPSCGCEQPAELVQEFRWIHEHRKVSALDRDKRFARRVDAVDEGPRQAGRCGEIVGALNDEHR